MNKKQQYIGGYDRVSTTSERIKLSMQENNVRQRDLVNETGMSRGAICRYISGEREPKLSTANKLGAALKVNDMWLLGYDVPKERTPEQLRNDKICKFINRLENDVEFADTVLIALNLTPSRYKTFVERVETLV